jgi:hypothetical protein
MQSACGGMTQIIRFFLVTRLDNLFENDGWYNGIF